MTTYAPNDAKTFVKKAFLAAGANEEKSSIMADTMIWASMRGIDSHGLTRVAVYLKRIETGIVDKDAEVEVIRSAPSAALLDAHNTFGQYAAVKAADLACCMAEKTGTATVAVRNSNHFGTAGYYVNEMAKRGKIGIDGADSSKAMVLFGAAKPFLGTNPFAYAVPAGKYPPIILDMATSVVARGKIRRALDTGKKIPLGWAVGPDGKPTDDPAEAYKGYVLPFGGAKGSAIALLVDILSAAASGAALSAEAGSLYNDFDRPQGIGHFFIAIDPASLVGREAFIRRMEALVERIKELPSSEAEGKVYLPGEIEHDKEIKSLKEGISVPPDMVKKLEAVAQKYSISMPTDIA